MAQSVRVVGVFIACGHLQHALFAQVVLGKVDPPSLTWVRQHGGERSRETELLIRVFAQDQTGIGRQTSPCEVEVNGFVPARCQLQWGCAIGWHRIDTREGVCSGVRRVHVGALPEIVMVDHILLHVLL